MCRDEQLFASYFEEFYLGGDPFTYSVEEEDESLEKREEACPERSEEAELRVNEGSPMVSHVENTGQNRQHTLVSATSVIGDLAEDSLNEGLRTFNLDEEESEGRRQWKWFLDLLEVDLALSENSPRYVFMSDQQKGLEKATTNEHAQTILNNLHLKIGRSLHRKLLKLINLQGLFLIVKIQEEVKPKDVGGGRTRIKIRLFI
ncbi:hypothetical protein AAHA92_06449 [Salvia divinorum]|uniref:Uncharacterized protein n=1 Tax=Salvia divinorum TaxID=28513 RepID=A0ABD1I7Z3_SALDI